MISTLLGILLPALPIPTAAVRSEQPAVFTAQLGGLAFREDVDERVEQALDICLDPDPITEAATKETKAGATGLICNSPSLRKRSRAIEALYHGAMAGDCLPDVFIVLRPVYDTAIADCRAEACATDAMDAFEHAIRATERSCRAAAAPSPARVVPKLVQDNLTRRLQKAGDLTGEDGERVSIDFSALTLAGRSAVLALGSNGAHNGPFWLFLRTGSGGWEEILSDDAGYLRPLEATTTTKNGMPVLRSQQHVSCCEHMVTFFAYDGQQYQAIESCSQLYDADENPLLFCDPPTDGRRG